MLSATWPQEVQRLARDYLEEYYVTSSLYDRPDNPKIAVAILLGGSG
jgi:hypothetical protein